MQMTRLSWSVSVAGVLLVACTAGEDPQVAHRPEDAPESSVHGVVNYDGPVPGRFLKKRRAVVGVQLNPPRVLATVDGRIADAVITLGSVAAIAALAAKPPLTVDVDQAGSVYAPHLAVVPVGGSVRFLNSDLILHNVHVRRGASSVDQRDMPAGGEWRFAVGDQPGALAIGCNFHPWMAGHIKVVETPYFARSDERGRFVISGVPDGRYRVRVWHADLVTAGDSPLEIEVEDGKADPIRLLLRSR